MEGELSLQIQVPCPICRNEVSADYDFTDNAEGTIGRFLQSVLRLECSECEEVYCIEINMIAEDDVNNLPYDPEELDPQ